MASRAMTVTRITVMMTLMTLWTSPVRARVVNDTEFLPSSSLVDYAFLLDPPAGKKGFLKVNAGGKFVWSTGERARFWGVNISRQSVFVDDAAIARVVDTLARSGVNLVRFEAIDAPGGLFDRGSPAIVPERLHTLDRWTTLLRDHGIYYYLDLLDLRVFGEGEGVRAASMLGPGARPYAMFDPTLIRLQKEFARQLLTRQNVFSGVRYVDDPALALVEICNESGFFLRPAVVDRLARAQRVASHPLYPYARELQSRWNRWLRERYASQRQMRAAWRGGIKAHEDPAQGGVDMPSLQGAPAGSRKTADYVRFLSDVQRAYFTEMRSYLRSIGLRVPITGVTSNNHLPDAASWSPLDFTAGNYFFDHPTFTASEWVGSLHFNDTNALRTRSVFGSAPFMAALRWGRKPVVIREWAQPWPNRYRAAAAPEIVAYALLQDLDGLLLFGYRTIPPASGKPALADFAHEADPTVWALFGACGLAFRRSDIATSPRATMLTYGPHEVFRWPAMIGERLQAAWSERVVAKLGAGSGASVSARRASLVSSHGQIVRHVGEGVLTVNAPRFKAIAGEIGRKSWTLRDGADTWQLETRSPVGSLVIQSLDGLPLRSSRRWHAMMVTGANNTGQRLETMPGASPGRYRIAATGRAPVLTGGSVHAGGLVIRRNGAPWLSLDLVGGTWEALVENRAVTLVCDTPGIRGMVGGVGFVTQAAVPVVVDR